MAKNNVKMSYEAMYLPKSESNLSKGGFNTEEEAWNYIYGLMCDYCKEEYRKFGNDAHLACLAEWDVDIEE